MTDNQTDNPVKDKSREKINEEESENGGEKEEEEEYDDDDDDDERIVVEEHLAEGGRKKKGKDLKVLILMNGRKSARQRTWQPPTYKPRPSEPIQVNKPLPDLNVSPRIDSKGQRLEHTPEPLEINKPLPELNVTPRIDNKGQKLEHTPQPLEINKPMPDLNVSPRVDNKGLKIEHTSTPIQINKPMPDLNVSPKIDNKGRKIDHEVHNLESDKGLSQSNESPKKKPDVNTKKTINIAKSEQHLPGETETEDADLDREGELQDKPKIQAGRKQTDKKKSKGDQNNSAEEAPQVDSVKNTANSLAADPGQIVAPSAGQTITQQPRPLSVLEPAKRSASLLSSYVSYPEDRRPSHRLPLRSSSQKTTKLLGSRWCCACLPCAGSICCLNKNDDGDFDSLFSFDGGGCCGCREPPVASTLSSLFPSAASLQEGSESRCCCSLLACRSCPAEDRRPSEETTESRAESQGKEPSGCCCPWPLWSCSTCCRNEGKEQNLNGRSDVEKKATSAVFCGGLLACLAGFCSCSCCNSRSAESTCTYCRPFSCSCYRPFSCSCCRPFSCSCFRPTSCNCCRPFSSNCCRPFSCNCCRPSSYSCCRLFSCSCCSPTSCNCCRPHASCLPCCICPLSDRCCCRTNQQHRQTQTSAVGGRPAGSAGQKVIVSERDIEVVRISSGRGHPGNN